MFELLDDEDQHISLKREILTIRYDKGTAYRSDEEWKDIQRKKGDKWAAEFAHRFVRALSKGKPHKIEPDDDWVLVVWGSLASKQSIREATVGLFIDAQETDKKPHLALYREIISATWKLMRKIGPVCKAEPFGRTDSEVRRHLDSVKKFSIRHQAIGFNEARGAEAASESPLPKPQNWVAQKTVVELDLVGYTEICNALEQGLDARTVGQLNEQIQSFINVGLASVQLDREDTLIANTGDGAILMFPDSQQAHSFAVAVHLATHAHNKKCTIPHAKRTFRIGVATGKIAIKEKLGGGFEGAGSTISRATRLEAKAKEGSILIDEPSFKKLTADQRKLYGPKLSVAGKRNEIFSGYCCDMHPESKKRNSEERLKPLETSISSVPGGQDQLKLLATIKYVVGTGGKVSQEVQYDLVTMSWDDLLLILKDKLLGGYTVGAYIDNLYWRFNDQVRAKFLKSKRRKISQVQWDFQIPEIERALDTLVVRKLLRRQPGSDLSWKFTSTGLDYLAHLQAFRT